MNFHGNARNHSTLSLAAPAEKRNPALKTLKPSNLHDILGPSVGFWYLDGVGFDIPWNSTLLPADPEKIYQSVLKSFEAGATGVVASREYEEMRLPNLRAFGRAIRELAAK